MELLELFTIQGTLFLMILVGALVKKLGHCRRGGGGAASPICASM